MSNNSNDCSMIEERINGYNLYISTTQEQISKLDPNEQDVQEKRDALTRKLDGLQEQLETLKTTLEDCRQGKETNLPDFAIVPEDGVA